VADFDHLEYVPRGAAARTRRAKKYSGLSAVVVRFSRSRGRYERQGILVEASALERAEKECQADAQRRAARSRQDEVRRMEQDRDLVPRMTQAILELFPSCPSEEARAIAAHTATRGSGRAGRFLQAERLNRRPSPPLLSRRFVTTTHVTISHSCVGGIETMPGTPFAMSLSE